MGSLLPGAVPFYGPLLHPSSFIETYLVNAWSSPVPIQPLRVSWPLFKEALSPFHR